MGQVWSYLTYPSRQPFFVYVVGPSSSGKTTLCNALSSNIHVSGYVKEVARTVMKQTGFSRADVGAGGKVEMQKAILKAQIAAEESEEGKPVGWFELFSRRLVLCDRSPLDPIVYADWCSSVENDKARIREELEAVPGFQQSVERMRRSLVVMLEPVEEWIVDDGVRSIGAHQTFYDDLSKTLDGYGIRWRRLGPGTRDILDRVAVVRSWIDDERA